jgi:hypothetical protein
MTANARPDAILLACWASSDPLLAGLDAEPSLIPLGDKPLLQRALEQLLELGCRHVAVIHGDQPQAKESFLGNGERWGCRITHHYAADDSRPLQRLAWLAPGRGESCTLASAESVAAGFGDLPQLFVACTQAGEGTRWAGLARLPGDLVRQLLQATRSREDLERRVLSGGSGQAAGLAQPVMVDAISMASVASALDSISRVLKPAPGACGTSRRPHAEGVWIGNGSRIHPGARLVAPVYIGRDVYIGEGACIGPHAVIGDNCIVDRASHVERSLLAPNTYAGQELEIADTILAGARLANARLGAVLQIEDPEFARDIVSERPGIVRPGVGQRFLAAMLCVALSPLILMRAIGSLRRPAVPGAVIGAPTSGSSPWARRQVSFVPRHEGILAAEEGAWVRHFRDTFVAGLTDVVGGRVALVGLQPRSVEEIHCLPGYWQSLYRLGPTGLVNETLLNGPEGAAAEMRFAGDALCASSMRLSKVSMILGRYFRRLVAECLIRQSGRIRASRGPASQPTP